MRRLSVLFLLVALACGKDNKPSENTKSTSTVSGEKPPVAAATLPETAVPKTRQELLVGVWAQPQNTKEDRALLSFAADGKFAYYVFNGKDWNKADEGTYKIEGESLIDTKSNATYKINVSESALSLDNTADGALDFMSWHKATVADWDPIDQKAPSPVK